MDGFPRYFVCMPAQQYVNVLSEDKAVMIDLYYNEVTGEVKYGYKTLDKRIVKVLLTDPGIYTPAMSGDWEYAKGSFLNWVKAALE